MCFISHRNPKKTKSGTMRRGRTLISLPYVCVFVYALNQGWRESVGSAHNNPSISKTGLYCHLPYGPRYGEGSRCWTFAAQERYQINTSAASGKSEGWRGWRVANCAYAFLPSGLIASRRDARH
ncbi:hypothetical protein BX600DRAFT_120995 [Xylariales sp. PMI_506]|nr:hypothetical protein BX600DRAFT_120995 [Xylariales sp. PMI_506]